MTLLTGMRRLIPLGVPPLRAWAAARIAGGTVLVGLGVITLSFGGNDWKTYGWTAFCLVLAALAFARGYWEL